MRCVLSRRWNVDSDAANVTCSGRSFQIILWTNNRERSTADCRQLDRKHQQWQSAEIGRHTCCGRFLIVPKIWKPKNLRRHACRLRMIVKLDLPAVKLSRNSYSQHYCTDCSYADRPYHTVTVRKQIVILYRSCTFSLHFFRFSVSVRYELSEHLRATLAISKFV